MTEEPQYEEIRIWEKTGPTKEPGMPVHDVFSMPIPGAFGIEFLDALIASTKENIN